MNDPASLPRIFLVIIDDSEEMRVALRYAALRARRTGGKVALLYVIDEPSDLQQWLAVESLMREERREEAEALLQRLSGEIADLCGSLPIIYIREGKRRDELLALLEEEPSISILVLAAGTGPEGPGPLVTQLVSKMSSRMRIPITVVPGNLSDEEIAALT